MSSIQQRSIDEYPIGEIPNTPLWTENFATLAADPISKVGVYYSCGRWIGDPTIWREVLSVYLPGDRIVFAKNYGRSSSSTGAGASLTSWTVVEPERELRLRFDGPVLESSVGAFVNDGFRDGPKGACSLDVRFDAVGPLWDMKHASNAAGEIAGALHIEQVGTGNGKVVYQGQTFELNDAYMIRDHSRGPRDLARYRWSCWMNGHLPGNRFFHLYAIQLQGADDSGMSNAGIFENGNYYPAELLRTDLLDDPVNPDARHTFVLGCEIGEFAVRTAEVITTYPSSMLYPYDMSPGWLRSPSTVHMVDQGVWYECRGERCLGWSERGFVAQPLA